MDNWRAREALRRARLTVTGLRRLSQESMEAHQQIWSNEDLVHPARSAERRERKASIRARGEELLAPLLGQIRDLREEAALAHEIGRRTLKPSAEARERVRELLRSGVGIGDLVSRAGARRDVDVLAAVLREIEWLPAEDERGRRVRQRDQLLQACERSIVELAGDDNDSLRCALALDAAVSEAEAGAKLAAAAVLGNFRETAKQRIAMAHAANERQREGVA